LLGPCLPAVAGRAAAGEVLVGIGAAVLERDDVVDVGRLARRDAAAVATDVGVAEEDPLPLGPPVCGQVVGPLLRVSVPHLVRPPSLDAVWHVLTFSL
jgi:hypothetical protein